METSFLDPVALRQLLSQQPAWLHLSVTLIAFVESFAILGIVVPGVALLAAASFAAGTAAVPLWSVLACAFAGAVAGDGVSFLIGRHYHQGIKETWPFRQNPHWISTGESFFDRYGVLSIVSGRFVGPIRPIIPLVAGMCNVPARLFYAINLLSALAWAPVYVLPGYLVGASLDSPFTTGRLLLLGGGGIALLLFFHALHRRYRN